MIGDLARRYVVALQTVEGRRRIATGYLIAAIVVNLIATLLLSPSSPGSKGPATFLLGIGCGMLIVSIIQFVSNRRVS
jgi:hypothetical protein